MDQPEFKVRFSLGSKLLLSVVSLLVLSIVFLMSFAIRILREDKVAYTFQAQSTEAQLVGTQLLSLVRQGSDTLRIVLSSWDPQKSGITLSPNEKADIVAVLGNQSDVQRIDLGWLKFVDKGAPQFTLIQREIKNSSSPDAVGITQLKVSPEIFSWSKDSLTQSGFALLGLAQPGSQAWLGIVTADLKKKSDKGIPIVLGFVAADGVGKDIRGSTVTVANRNGMVLFSTDPQVMFDTKSVGDQPFFQEAVTSQFESGAKEIEGQEGHLLASYVKPGLEMIVTSTVQWQKAMKASYALTEQLLLLAAMAVGAAILFAIFFARSLTAPLFAVYAATREVTQGNFDVQLDISSKDEIGALAGSFRIMSAKINDLIQESMRKVMLENELAIASTVQQTLIPPSLTESPNYTIHSHYQSAAECGGDWWGHFEVDGKLCLMISDATGHGLPSALITASARSCFSVMHKLAQEDPDFGYSPGSMLSYANRVIYDSAQGQIMMTFFMGVIDFAQGKLTYSSAGHNPPWLFKKNGDSFKLNSLTVQGNRLGEAHDVPMYEEKTIDIAPGDILFMYTDGLMEGNNTAGEMYGKKRVKRLVESTLSAGAQTVVTEVVKDFLAYNEGKQLDDDLTIAVTQIGMTQNG